MKELFIAPLTPSSTEFLKWFNQLYYGTKAARSIRLYALNEKYCLFKVVHPGYSPPWGPQSSSSTEYIVSEINSKLSGYGIPASIHKVQGRMLNTHIEYIEKTYKLKITK
jgi:hypothetical protein